MSADDVRTISRLADLATPMTIRVAVTLGLPDRLRDEGATADDLAAELDASPVGVATLLAHLATVGIVETTASGYRTTDLGATLCTDADNWLSMMLHLDSANGRSDLAFVELAHTVATGGAAYPRRYGQDFWADAVEHPHLRESFDRQMTLRLHHQRRDIVEGVGWERFSRVVDVGGGQGTLLAAILEAHPHLDGHLVDLAPTAAEASRTLGDRATVSAGSFFDALPAGADAYLLCDILHDWDDAHAGRILARCAEAARPDGRILVIEAVGGEGRNTLVDLCMLAFYGGRDRRVDEFRELAAPHGLVVDSVTRVTDERSLIELRRATG